MITHINEFDMSREKAGHTVTPEWPPTTGTTTSGDLERSPIASATKVDARTTSNVVTPNSLSKISADLPGTGARLPLGVENSSLLEDLSNNGDGRIDRIRNNENKCFGSCRRNTNGQIMDDTSIDLLTVRSPV